LGLEMGAILPTLSLESGDADRPRAPVQHDFS
jgi:hypothetical protein